MSDICPLCGSNCQGEPISQEYIDKGYYAEGATHYSRIIGYEERGVYDGVLIWMCPDCGGAWPRFENGYRHEKALELIQTWMEARND